MPEALPFTFSRAERICESAATRWMAEEEASLLPDVLPAVSERLHFHDFQLKPGARVLAAAEDGTPLIIAGPCAKGRIVVCNGLYTHALPAQEARTLAGSLVALAREATYRPQTGWSEESAPYGTMTLCAVGGDGPDSVSALPQWEDRQALWAAFSERGSFEGIDAPQGPSAPGRTWNGALCARVSLNPGETKTATFILTWHFPNRMRDHRYIAGPRRSYTIIVWATCTTTGFPTPARLPIMYLRTWDGCRRQRAPFMTLSCHHPAPLAAGRSNRQHRESRSPYTCGLKTGRLPPTKGRTAAAQ